PGLVSNDLQSLSVNVVASLADVPNPDVALIGGGSGQIEQMRDGSLHEWLRTVDQTTAWTASVCTGTLILAAAGLLEGRRATTHWATLDHLTAFGVTPSKERVVIDGHYATAAGVSAGIDLGLTLAGMIAGHELAQAIQLIIEYAPDPPYAAGTLASASPGVIERAKERLPKRVRPSGETTGPARSATQ
ncbi:MAG TPA: DJ-1/PfpI family protein, partial [Solirubrobacteraceae bacterium]|nr:DJ-1/PfpI family protein [Solirubrobacteraceae bacterium]